ncbi:hypothetical protein ACX6C2_003038 [Listeria monocytogenes]
MAEAEQLNSILSLIFFFNPQSKEETEVFLSLSLLLSPFIPDS